MVKTEHQPGVVSRGVGMVALLAIAVIVALLMATKVMDQVRAIGVDPSAPQGPAAVAAYESR